jgi:hypothetical protein
VEWFHRLSVVVFFPHLVVFALTGGVFLFFFSLACRVVFHFLCFYFILFSFLFALAGHSDLFFFYLLFYFLCSLCCIAVVLVFGGGYGEVMCLMMDQAVPGWCGRR